MLPSPSRLLFTLLDGNDSLRRQPGSPTRDQPFHECHPDEPVVLD